MNALTHIPGLHACSPDELIRMADAEADAPPLMAAVATALAEMTAQVASLEATLEEFQESDNEQIKSLEAQIAEGQRQLDTVNAEADKLFDQRADLKDALRTALALLRAPDTVSIVARDIEEFITEADELLAGIGEA